MAYKIKCAECGLWHYPENCPLNKKMVNNKKGYNKHKKNPKAKPKPKKEPITLMEVQEAYREMWKAQAIYKGKASYYGNLHNKFLGLDKIDKELEKEGEE